MAPQSTSTIQADFDRLALLTVDQQWSHNSHYDSYLLRHVPTPCREALDIGCGTGAFARSLAERSDHVLGIDLSPEMVRVATSRSDGYPNIEYRVADVMQLDLPGEQYDCIASIATLHHMPTDAILREMKAALKPGGTLLVLDLYEAEGWADRLTNVLALPLNLVLRLVKQRRLRESPEVRAAWEEHGRGDRYLTLGEVRRICAKVLPGAKVKRHLLWRYSLVWRKVEKR
ncbi:MAG TPA: class I SAM-dependent methyltransferase [Chloroflexia bacterium]